MLKHELHECACSLIVETIPLHRDYQDVSPQQQKFKKASLDTCIVMSFQLLCAIRLHLYKVL